MKRLLNILLLFSSSVVLLTSCDLLDGINPKPKDKLKVYRGTTVDLGPGKATAWISVNQKDEPVELGVELTEEALNLTPTSFRVDAVPLPDRAKELTPFDHIQISWASLGHPLPGPTGPSFIGPHYDVRFSMTSLQEQLTIPTPTTDPSAKFDVLPPAGYMPANYKPDAASPGIGLNWTDMQFLTGMTNAMILGTYNGKFIFIAPIVTLGELQSGNRTSKSFAQPLYFQKTNTYYPTSYTIDAKNQMHQVTLIDFIRR